MPSTLEFKNNPASRTIGIELELQLINLHTKNLIFEASDLLRRVEDTSLKDHIKPEITQAMIEINSSIHCDYDSLFLELSSIKEALLELAKKVHIGICGGGAHPFQKWQEQKVFQAERFLSVAEQYGYLAKQFTVFGQHIHISCTSGDEALYLCHAFSYYIPHFIALAASSPFNQGVDTSFDCSRLSVISAFPLSGTPPWLFHWGDFNAYFYKLYNLGAITSIKDFYWDIRPKPEYGTVEIRICDAPLTIQKACDVAFYAYNLASYLLAERPQLTKEIYLTYLINRFRASRFGFQAEIIDPINQTSKMLRDDIVHTCSRIGKYATNSNSAESIKRIEQSVINYENDASWLRNIYKTYDTLEDVVRLQVDLWST